MEEHPEAPETAAPPPPPAPAPAQGAWRRLTVLLLFALFGLSFAAAVVLVRGGQGLERFHAVPLIGKPAGRDAVGWLTLRGPIYDSQDGGPWSISQFDHWVKRLKEFAEKAEVKAIVLEINSPGGSVAAVQEIHGQVLRVRRESRKPVIALMGDVAASGGYYVAAACDRIVARPGTLTGSIGVIFGGANVEGLFGKLGLRWVSYKSGKHKDIGSPFRPETPEEKALLQGIINDAYRQFLEAVAEGRGRSVEAMRPLADGRIYTGSQARELGLVDETGTSEDALRLAKEMGGIVGKPRILRRDEPLDFLISVLESRWRPRGLEAALAPLAAGPRLEYRWTGALGR
jgi:protease-4